MAQVQMVLAISSGEIRLQNLSKETPGVTKFGNIYGCITNINLFIARVTDANFIPEAKKNYYLGQAYGVRAFYYFDLYKVFMVGSNSSWRGSYR